MKFIIILAMLQGCISKDFKDVNKDLKDVSKNLESIKNNLNTIVCIQELDNIKTKKEACKRYSKRKDCKDLTKKHVMDTIDILCPIKKVEK